MKTFSYFTILGNWIKGFDKYQRIYSKKMIQESSFPNDFYLLDESQYEIGIEKAKNLMNKLNIKNNKIIKINTKIDESLIRKNHKNNKGWILNQNYIEVDSVEVFNGETFVPIIIEELFAMAYQLESKEQYNKLKPRSVSFLPIAQACQAKCWFCFSEYSISKEKEYRIKDWHLLENLIKKSKDAGAERFVITGGGEPGLLPIDELILVIKLAKKYFDKIVLITNGMFLSYKSEVSIVKIIKQLENAGLSVLSISRHHYDDNTNIKIMGVDTRTNFLLNILQSFNHLINIRLICVLQKDGICSKQTIQDYVKYAQSHNVKEICFKELYVASSIDSIYNKNPENIYSHNQQISLKEVLNYCHEFGYKKIAELPWGSPVFSNNLIKIAAYTEPSVGWELTNGICRSWNIMADLKNYATLEDLNSLLE